MSGHRPWRDVRLDAARARLAATVEVDAYPDGVDVVEVADGLTLVLDPGADPPLALRQEPPHAGAAVHDAVVPLDEAEADRLARGLLALLGRHARLELAARLASQDATRAGAVAELEEDLP